MAYSRPFGQQQAASPWSSGAPPGPIQQQQPPAPQPPTQGPPPQMFSQPMGPFDPSTWQSQHQHQPPPQPSQVAVGQWPPPQPIQVMQAPVQFVPNSGPFMQPMQMHIQPQFQQQRFNQHQQQRANHQRSLSAPRIGGGQNNKRAGNQNNSFGGGQRQFNNNNSNNNNNMHNNNNNQNQKANRQQAKPGNQKVQFSNNTNNHNSNTKNNSPNNNRQQNQNLKQQPQSQSQPQQQQSKGPVKVTRAAKKQALAQANRGPVKNNNKANAGEKGKEATNVAGKQQESKPQSKTAERRQLKLQARKNAEALKMSSLPVVKSNKAPADKHGDVRDEPQMDQSQLKCVPAVFGFVCKVCDVFLRDRVARREHIDLEEHMQRFKVFEEEQQKLAASKSEEVKSEPVENSDQIAPEKPAASAGEEVNVGPSGDEKTESAGDAVSEQKQEPEAVAS